MMMVRLFAGLLVVVAVLGAGFLVGMRAKFAPVQTAVRKVNRVVWNPMALRDAGEEGASASVVRHRGRRSGAEYQTPVGAYHVDDAIYVVLPYGPDTDWRKNLSAAGSGEVVHEGETFAVGTPEVLSIADNWEVIPEKERTVLRAFKVDSVLRLPVIESAA